MNLNQSVLCVHGNDPDADEMNTEFNRLKSNPSKLAHLAFIKKYEKRPGAESKVNLIRQRLRALSGNSREDYERVVRSLRTHWGAFFLGVMTPEAPTYKSHFHIVQYKRIKVYASTRPGYQQG